MHKGIKFIFSGGLAVAPGSLGEVCTVEVNLLTVVSHHPSIPAMERSWRSQTGFLSD